MDDLTRYLLDARDGDRTAFAAAVRRSQGEVWRLCAHLCGRAEADDLTQDTYVRVVRALPSFRGDSSGRTWILAITRHACADSIRRATRARRRDALASTPFVERDPTDGLAVEALIGMLDPGPRAAFVLTQLHGLSYAEAAEVCAVPVGTIRSRVARARALLVDRVYAADAV